MIDKLIYTAYWKRIDKKWVYSLKLIKWNPVDRIIKNKYKMPEVARNTRSVS